MLEPETVRQYERQLTAMVTRAGQDDPEAFAEVVRLLDAARADLPRAADMLRTESGYSWRDLARALGITHVSALRRFKVAADVSAR